MYLVSWWLMDINSMLAFFLLFLYLVFHVVPPNIMGEEQNVSVLISQAVELICQSDAVPPPTLLWLKDGRPLLKKPGVSISEDGSVLKVRL